MPYRGSEASPGLFTQGEAVFLEVLLLQQLFCRDIHRCRHQGFGLGADRDAKNNQGR